MAWPLFADAGASGIAPGPSSAAGSPLTAAQAAADGAETAAIALYRGRLST